MLISEDYKQQNSQLHASRSDYGTGGRAVANHAEMLARLFHCADALDYGCGKGTLAVGLRYLGSNLIVTEYDPAVEGKDAPPKPAELVVCSDVLEHVEPECLDAVWYHIHSLTKKALFFTVHCGPAQKTLPDGRNAHLTQQPPEWWLTQAFRLFKFHSGSIGPDHLGCCLLPREDVPAWWRGC